MTPPPGNLSMTVSASRPLNPRRAVRFALFAVFVIALLGLPFALFGEEYVVALLGNEDRHAWLLAAMGIALLTADSLAPVPSSLVIVAVALKAGWFVGTVAGTVGLCGQVIGAAWFGRVALGRVASRVFSVADLDSMRAAVPQRLALTLGCMRSVPLLAETSVAIAASVGIPLPAICRVTLLPNLAIAATYSLAAQAGLWAAVAAVVASIVMSLVAWRLTRFASA